MAACRVVRPGHDPIPVDPAPDQPDLKLGKEVVQPVRLPMARKHTKTLMTEKDGIRGLVPARNRGYRDRVFAEYLDTLNPRANVLMQKALAASPDVRFQKFLDRVMTPKYRRASLATISKGCSID